MVCLVFIQCRSVCITFRKSICSLEIIINAAERLRNRREPELLNDLNCSSQPHSSDSSERRRSGSPSAKMPCLLAKYSRVRQHRSSSELLSLRRQLTQYLEEVVELNKASENVFKFWKEHAILYPELSILAFQVLWVPATSAPVERVFSQSGLLFRPHPARLSFDLLSMLVCLKR